MKAWNYLMAAVIGIAVPWGAMFMTGHFAALPVPVGHDWILLYSNIVVALPFISAAAVGAWFLITLGATNSGAAILAYTAAVVMFLILMSPWSLGGGVILGLAMYWDHYFYLAVLPALAWVLTSKKRQLGA